MFLRLPEFNLLSECFLWHDKVEKLSAAFWQSNVFVCRQRGNDKKVDGEIEIKKSGKIGGGRERSGISNAVLKPQC